MMKNNEKEFMYYGGALLILLVFLYIIYTVIYDDDNNKKNIVHGCGSKCKGNCRMGINAKRMKELKVIFVKMEGCIHCKRLQSLLENNKVDNLVEIVDSESPRVVELMKEYGTFSGFPTLISVKTKKKIIGGRSKLEDILDELD